MANEVLTANRHRLGSQVQQQASHLQRLQEARGRTERVRGCQRGAGASALMAIHAEFKTLSKTWEGGKLVEAERALASSEAFREGLRKNLDQITQLHEAAGTECAEFRRLERWQRSSAYERAAYVRGTVMKLSALLEDTRLDARA